MLIIDAHLDLSWNALGWNRELDKSVAEIRQTEASMSGKARGKNTVSFPEMRRGQVGIALATVLARWNPDGKTSLDFRSQEIASATAQGQLAYYRLLERRKVCRMIENWESLEKIAGEWQGGCNDAPFGFILAMEGADPIVSPEHVIDWYRAGLRVVGLAHYGPSAYACGTGSQGGLTPKGRDLLQAMEETNLILDMTHLADASFWQAAEAFHGPVLASHNNCRAITPADRQFDDDQIRLIVERQGVIGIPFDAWMMDPQWSTDRNKSARVTLETAIRHIDHICQLAGDALHVAIGSDLDGGFGTEQGPEDLDSIADLQRLHPLLLQHGYSEADVAGIFHGNWLRFFQRVWQGQ